MKVFCEQGRVVSEWTLTPVGGFHVRRGSIIFR